MSYEPTGPLLLLSFWAAHKDCAGQRMCALNLDQSSRTKTSFLGSSQKLKKNLPTFYITSLTNILVEQEADFILSWQYQLKKVLLWLDASLASLGNVMLVGTQWKGRLSCSHRHKTLQKSFQTTKSPAQCSRVLMLTRDYEVKDQIKRWKTMLRFYSTTQKYFRYSEKRIR